MNPSTPASGVTPILMPQPGQSMEEGVIVRWLVGEGDTVRKGDVLFEVETDKAVVEIEATESGRLARILVGEGETAAVKAPVALLAENDAAVADYLSGPTEEAPAVVEPSAVSAPPSMAAPPPLDFRLPPSSGRVAASPLARKVAAANGIALESVGGGSGPRGRIMLCDVEKAAEAQPHPAQAQPPMAAPAIAPAIPVREGGTRRPMSRMRKAIARNLTASKQNIPHFYMKTTVEADAMLAFYKAEKQNYPCSLNDVITLAVARAVMEFPAFRGQIDGDEVVEFPDANIGIAVGVEDGLVVPVLRAADTRNLKGIAAETRRLVEAARAGKVEGMGEGAFTISNLGMFGIEEFTAIVNPPESAILAVGATREEIIVKEGAFRAGRRLTLTLSADHRLIDGLLAARFMARLKALLEDPTSLR